jgi:LysR family glycine cleavage system transcriptional activator
MRRLPPCAPSRRSSAPCASAPRGRGGRARAEPSALSRRIGNLEEFTGKKMFSRTGQAMRLTDEGRNFYDAIAPHLEALAMAVESQSENLQLLRLGSACCRCSAPSGCSQAARAARAAPAAAHRHRHRPAPDRRVGDTLDAAIALMTDPEPGCTRSSSTRTRSTRCAAARSPRSSAAARRWTR